MALRDLHGGLSGGDSDAVHHHAGGIAGLSSLQRIIIKSDLELIDANGPLFFSVINGLFQWPQAVIKAVISSYSLKTGGARRDGWGGDTPLLLRAPAS